MANQDRAGAGAKAEVGKIRPLERGLQALCMVLLVSISALTLVAAALTFAQGAGGKPPKTAGPASAQGAAGQAGAGSPADAAAMAKALKEMKDQIDAEQKKVDQSLDSTKTLLSTLITLVGVYSVIVAATAFVTIKFAREDAREQIGSMSANAKSQVDSMREDSREKIKDLGAKIGKIQQDFPEFAFLHEQMGKLVRDIQSSIPPESDWNDNDSYDRLNEEARQRILRSEVTVTAMSVFALDKSALIRGGLATIYGGFARFYLARHNKGTNDIDGDYERALFYAGLAIAFSEYSAGSLRLRGAIYLSRYDQLSKRQPPVEAARLKTLLTDAQTELSDAIRKDTDEIVDAGAHYNKAVAETFAGKREEAVKTLRGLIQLKGRISRAHRKKYLPSAYQNLACYLALDAAEAGKTDAARATELSKEAVAAAKDGAAEFQAADDKEMLAEFLGAIEDELKPGKDFAGLAQEYRDQLDQVGKAPAPVPGGASAGAQAAQTAPAAAGANAPAPAQNASGTGVTP
jgi:hypothetical protein